LKRLGEKLFLRRRLTREKCVLGRESLPIHKFPFSYPGLHSNSCPRKQYEYKDNHKLSQNALYFIGFSSEKRFKLWECNAALVVFWRLSVAIPPIVFSWWWGRKSCPQNPSTDSKKPMGE
jgi:hypothetical protein